MGTEKNCETFVPLTDGLKNCWDHHRQDVKAKE